MGLLLFGFLVFYPLLQAWTLWRCRDGWRIASVICLVPTSPFYLWTLYKVMVPQPSGDLSGLLVEFLAPWPLLYLVVLAVAYEVRRQAVTSQDEPVP